MTKLLLMGVTAGLTFAFLQALDVPRPDSVLVPLGLVALWAATEVVVYRRRRKNS